MIERTPPYGTGSGQATNDPEQLPLGGFEGTPFLPPGERGRGEGSADGEGVIATREPPVCGEWSFDASDEAEARGTAPLVNTPQQAPQHTPPIAPPPPPVRQSLRTPPMQRSLTPPTPLPALEELRSIHEAHPGDVKTAVALAGALDKRGNIEGGLSVLLRAIDAGADGVVLRCARATILSNRLRYDDAESELKKAAKLRGDDPEVLLQQGILACRRAKWRDAVEPLEHVAKLSPQSGPAHFYLGEALNKLDRLKEALAAYEKASELEPGNWRAFKGVGIVLDRMGRPADAAAFYRRARDAQSG
jgi:Flp pilus assembly protein TadD